MPCFLSFATYKMVLGTVIAFSTSFSEDASLGKVFGSQP